MASADNAAIDRGLEPVDFGVAGIGLCWVEWPRRTRDVTPRGAPVLTDAGT